MLKKTAMIMVFILLTVFAGSSVLASDLIQGEYRLTMNYQEELEDNYPPLISTLNLEFARSNLYSGFHFDLEVINNLAEESLEIKPGEVFFEYYGDSYDLKLGRQREVWGTALEFNPTDNLNPAGIDQLNGDKEAVAMGRINYYLENGYTMTGVVIPYHQPALEALPLPTGAQLQATAVENNLENTEYALKFAGRGIRGIDYSLSYYRGFEDLPTVIFEQTPMGPVPSSAYFREYNVLGADLATSINGIGLWAEAAYMKPTTGEEYGSLVMGSDYKFPGEIYLEGQLIYRLDQWQNENILLQQALEKTFGGIHQFRLGSIYNVDTAGYLLKPELEFSLADAAVLNVSYQYSEGQLIKNEMMDLPLSNGLQAEISYSF